MKISFYILSQRPLIHLYSIHLVFLSLIFSNVQKLYTDYIVAETNTENGSFGSIFLQCYFRIIYNAVI